MSGPHADRTVLQISATRLSITIRMGEEKLSLSPSEAFEMSHYLASVLEGVGTGTFRDVLPVLGSNKSIISFEIRREVQ